MPANSNIVGRLYNVNTTGFITSAPTQIVGWLQTRYSTGAATISTGANIVDRASGVRLVGAKLASGQSIFVPLPTGVIAFGLSCTALVSGTAVRIYVK